MKSGAFLALAIFVANLANAQSQVSPSIDPGACHSETYLITLATKKVESSTHAKVTGGTVRWAGKPRDAEIFKTLTLTPNCAGTFTINAEHHGGEGPYYHSTCVSGDLSQTLCRASGKEERKPDNGASLRITAGNPVRNVCHTNDGSSGPPGPNLTWSNGTRFSAYNLTCLNVKVAAEAGKEESVTVWAWNDHANIKPGKSGFYMSVLFTPIQP